MRRMAKRSVGRLSTCRRSVDGGRVRGRQLECIRRLADVQRIVAWSVVERRLRITADRQISGAIGRRAGRRRAAASAVDRQRTFATIFQMIAALQFYRRVRKKK